MTEPRRESPLPPSLAADGMQGADAKADGHCGAQHSSQADEALILARVALESARAQLDALARSGTRCIGWCAMTGLRLTCNRCQCPTCGEYFGSVRGFDRHRIGAMGAPDRRSLAEGEMLAAGWVRNLRGFLLAPDPRRAGAGLEDASEGGPATQIRRAA